MLDAIGAGSSKQIGSKDWADVWLESPEFAAVKQEINRIKEDGLATPEDLDPSLHLECASTFLALGRRCAQADPLTPRRRNELCLPAQDRLAAHPPRLLPIGRLFVDSLV